MSDQKKRQQSRLSVKMCALLLGLCLVVGMGAGAASAEGNVDTHKLQNGSFEEGQTFTKDYDQPDQKNVPYWNTTAFEGKIELLRKNTGTYIDGVTLKPSDGTYAAELNADEESTLYQVVKTSPSSIYEWGLDHGGRTTMDTMALVIGPKQSVDPSKPSKAGRDQFMQMVDWLIAQGKTSVKDSEHAGLGEQFTVYSKKFADSGTFEDNAGNNAFSLTPSTIYTEEWHIWIMASGKATSGDNPWSHYGSNAEGSAEQAADPANNSTEIDLSKYYLYTVPTGQTETVFSFVSVGCLDNKGNTFGNFLDNINFHLYHPLSGSTSTHGSAVIGGSDGTAGGEGATKGHEVTVGEKYTTYVTDGEPLKVQAVVRKADAADGCEFVGVYYTHQDENGDPVTVFLQLAGNEVNDSATDEEKSGKWVKSTSANGDIIYTYHLSSLTSPTALSFVFIKSPTITYDPNGGKAYVVERTYNNDEAENVYSFKPVVSTDDHTFISPYVSHEAEAQNEGWKFMGWLLTGDTVDNVPSNMQVNADELGSLILPAEHTIACDYSLAGVSGDQKAQYFKIYDGQVALTGNETDAGVSWEGDGKLKYANVHKGLTLVAQWRWRQAFIPQVGSGTTYVDSKSGGTVMISGVTEESYGKNGGKAYFAATNEVVTAKATAGEGFAFQGWYDAKGNLLTTNDTYSYTETKESVNTCYARFSKIVKQTYIRQVKSGNVWEMTTDDGIGILGRYSYDDAVGMPISCTATAGNGYKFVGWYDSNGCEVSPSLLSNSGTTLGYTTTGDATYYARFISAEIGTVTQTYVRQIGSGSIWTDTNDDTIGTLTHYSYTDVAGTSIRVIAAAKEGYYFAGWYDPEGTCVSSDTTFSYTTAWNATYYARFSEKEKRPEENEVTAIDYDAPYDGGAHGITINGATLPGDTVYYSTDRINWSTTAPSRTKVQSAETIYVKVENPIYKTAETYAAITITGAEDITVTKTPAQTSVTAGDTITWTVTVHNSGSAEAKGLILTDTLEGAVITDPGNVDPAGFDLAVGESISFTVTRQNAPVGTYVNHVEVSQPKYQPLFITETQISGVQLICGNFGLAVENHFIFNENDHGVFFLTDVG